MSDDNHFAHKIRVTMAAKSKRYLTAVTMVSQWVTMVIQCEPKHKPHLYVLCNY